MLKTNNINLNSNNVHGIAQSLTTNWIVLKFLTEAQGTKPSLKIAQNEDNLQGKTVAKY